MGFNFAAAGHRHVEHFVAAMVSGEPAQLAAFAAFIKVKKLDELVGWRRFGQQLDAVAQGAPVIANRHQDAADAAFYMKGQPEVWASSVGSRPTAFDYMRDKPDIRSMPRVLFLGTHVKQFCDEYGFAPGETGRFTIVLPSGNKRDRAWTMMYRTETAGGNVDPARPASPTPATRGSD